ISGDTVSTAGVLDFEVGQSYSIRVQVSDGAGGNHAQALTISLDDVNEQPTDLTLTPNHLAENNAPGAVIGTLAAVDPDAAETFTYDLVTGSGDSDNTAFTIAD